MNAAAQQSDESLMLAWAAGDQTSFGLLYARHEAPLLRFIIRTLGQRYREQAEEVFQETWLRIIKARESFQPQGARWRTWAFTIAYNAAMDWLRRDSRTPDTVALFDAQAEAGEAGLPQDELAMCSSRQAIELAGQQSAEEQAYWRAAGQQLVDCLEQLPAEQRAAFLLRYEQDLSMQELAAQLDIAFEALRSRLRYATKKLRQCMGGYVQALKEKS